MIYTIITNNAWFDDLHREDKNRSPVCPFHQKWIFIEGTMGHAVDWLRATYPGIDPCDTYSPRWEDDHYPLLHMNQYDKDIDLALALREDPKWEYYRRKENGGYLFVDKQQLERVTGYRQVPVGE
jgi:hypothetical protein